MPTVITLASIKTICLTVGTVQKDLPKLNEMRTPSYHLPTGKHCISDFALLRLCFSSENRDNRIIIRVSYNESKQGLSLGMG